METQQPFTCLEEWQEWRLRNAWSIDPQYIAELVGSACREGIESPWLGKVSPEGVEVAGRNYRESFKAGGLNARVRAVLDHFSSMPDAAGRFTTRIYAPEALTPFALELRGKYARFVGSEYLPDLALQKRYFPISHQDLTRLSFHDESFDVAFCNEVFEHVPDLPQSLSEICRVLRKGGSLVSTFPFAYNQYETIVKASLSQGHVQIAGEPEYHENPVDPQGSLVYQIPGWDILDLARKQGFSRAELVFISSKVRGICATELAGIFLLRAVR